MKKVLTPWAINMSTKLHLLKCYVWSTLLYGCESWTVSQRMKSQLEATEMWFLRRMLRIAWTDKMSHKEVHQRANTSRNLLKIIVNRQIRFVGYIVRKGSQLEAIALTGMIEGKRARGRQRKTFTDWLSFACGEQWKVWYYWKSAKNVMSIDRQRQSLTRHLHWIVKDCFHIPTNYRLGVHTVITYTAV